MSATFLYQNDIDPAILLSRPIGVLGYGSQGRSHALNLRDSGHQVVVAQRPGSVNHRLALDDGFTPVSIGEAAGKADLLIFALPDDAMGDAFENELSPHLRAGQSLGFLHGFAIRFGAIKPPANVDVILVAPKGPGPLVRESFVRGGGLTCMIGVHQNATGTAKQIALAWAAGIGGGKGGILETTFAEECEADLFGEQVVLCGGIIELMKAAFDVLVEAGYPPEIAYFECIHEVKQIVDMQYAAGLEGMRSKISRTAAYGGLTRGPRLVTDSTRAEMRSILGEIRSGRFAETWLEECRGGKAGLKRLTDAEFAHPCEEAGRTVRQAAKATITAAGPPDLAKGPEPG